MAQEKKHLPVGDNDPNGWYMQQIQRMGDKERTKPTNVTCGANRGWYAELMQARSNAAEERKAEERKAEERKAEERKILPRRERTK